MGQWNNPRCREMLGRQRRDTERPLEDSTHVAEFLGNQDLGNDDAQKRHRTEFSLGATPSWAPGGGGNP